MNTRFVPVLLALGLAACTPQTEPPAPTAVALPAAAAPAPPPPSEAQIAPGRWDVERVRCSDLLGADDDDRAAAAMTGTILMRPLRTPAPQSPMPRQRQPKLRPADGSAR